jgi:hypothetical protein
LASLLALLLEARFQPAHPITFGNAVIKRVLQLSHAPPGMRLRHLADSVSFVIPSHKLMSAVPFLHWKTLGLSTSTLVLLACCNCRECPGASSK